VHIERSEIDYLCQLANNYFRRTLTPADVRWSYSGVRPLLEDQSSDASSVTRDYRLEVDAGGPVLLSVFGGKITTYRRLAEEAMSELLPRLQRHAPRWTAHAPLPGGDLPKADFGRFLRGLRAQYPWLPPSLRRRYARAYGSRISTLLAHATQLNDLGEQLLPGLFVREVNYLREVEWAVSAADILWRRSKLGLHLPPDSEAWLDEWLRKHPRTPLSTARASTARASAARASADPD
jgi:glycerol-3-phosphate dehydrogenase